MFDCRSLELTQKNLLICHLDNHCVIKIEGNDVIKYLQGQLTSDISKLSDNQSILTAHCDAKGKVISIFHLIRLHERLFYALIRNDIAESVLVQLKKYAVFSAVSFTHLTSNIYGIAGKNASSFISQTEFSDNQSNEIIQVCLAYSQPRYIIITRDSLNFKSTHPAYIWDLLDIQDGVPVLSHKNIEKHIPQALNLQLLEATISFTKGCFIGQETIARAKYRGTNKKSMFTFIGKMPVLPKIGNENKNRHEDKIGDKIDILLGTEWRKTGEISYALHNDDYLWLQVILNNQFDTNATFRLSAQNDLPLCLYPLPYTLEP